ncbi:MAG TPA: hypothetical protein VGG25_10310 [Streptosporangiaceae bacterium]|jgi:hypothetical protein
MKSVFKPEDSIVAGLATVGLVYGMYQLNLGTVASAQYTDANHPIMETSRKKAGYTSLVLVAGIALLARDPNIVILGGATIIAMELHYRHAIMSDPDSGQIVAPGPQAYQPAAPAA